MAEDQVTLELLLNKATSPSLYDDDWDAIAAFCDQVNKEMDGPHYALRLLAHKIQSPTEREALSALSTLEACVKHCGVSFHKEIGKFRFLNEIIKSLSPKFLGRRTTERVKKRCIELLYSWQRGLPHETKLAEAYNMLKEQKIIKEDPTYMDKVFELFPTPKPRRADFEDDEKAKELERLLKSKKAKDLKAANNLIKELVKKDSAKVEKRVRRRSDLETINKQGQQLTEMVKRYISSPDKASFDSMKEVYENLEKQRPSLFKLAGETEEQETEAMDDILKVNDEVTKAMLLYMRVGEEGSRANGTAESGPRDSSLLDLGMGSQGQQQTQALSEPAAGASAILQSDFQNLGLGGSPSAASPYSHLGSLFPANQQQQQQAGQVSLAQAAMGAPGAAGFQAQNSRPLESGAPPGMFVPSSGSMQPSASSAPVQQPSYFAAAQMISASLGEPSVFSASTSASAATMPTALSSSSSTSMSSAAAAAPSAMADIDALGQSLLEKNRTKDFVRPSPGPPPKLTMNQLAAAKTATTTTTTSQPQPQQPALPLSVLDSPLQPAQVNGAPLNSASLTNGTHGSLLGGAPVLPIPPNSFSPLQETLPLADLFVPLESIKPAENLGPVTLYDKNGLKSMIHFSEGRPMPEVLVMVMSTLSTNTKPVTAFVFQAAVPKVMKVKLQSPSSSTLPAFNPILPPTAITQIMLVANPRKEAIRLKFKISYVLGDDPVSDVGDVENFPIQ